MAVIFLFQLKVIVDFHQVKLNDLSIKSIVKQIFNALF